MAITERSLECDNAQDLIEAFERAAKRGYSDYHRGKKRLTTAKLIPLLGLSGWRNGHARALFTVYKTAYWTEEVVEETATKLIKRKTTDVIL